MQKVKIAALVEDYEITLENKLRGFTPKYDFIESWVHDEDMAKSLINLFEAAIDHGSKGLSVEIKKAEIEKISIRSLLNHLEFLGSVEVGPNGNSSTITVQFHTSSKREYEGEHSPRKEQEELILDGSKVLWHKERIDAWLRGERIAPITIDMALTRACNFSCGYCYATLQENERKKITQKVMYDFLQDCADIGVKAISLVSDGESTLSPVYIDTIIRGSELGIDMASGTNGFIFNRRKLELLLPHLTYIRINITAGEPQRYAEIMGVKQSWFYRVVQNIKDMVSIKQQNNLNVTIGMQMVLMPEFEDQILPLARLGKELRPDYLVIKHCSDDENGSLGVDYSGYKKMYDKLKEAEQLSDNEYKVIVKWSKIEAEGKRNYQRCYGPPFIIQLSGSGLVAPCGMLFGEKYNKYHIGNIVDTRFKEIWQSDRYWEVMNELASPRFNAQTMCGTLCLQHKTNEVLDGIKKENDSIGLIGSSPPQHSNFI